MCSELVHVVGSVGQGHQGLDVVLGDRDVIEEGLGLGWVHARHGCLINQILLLNKEVGVDCLDLVNQSTTNLIHHDISLVGHIRLNATSLEVLHNLTRNFSENLSSKHIWISLVLQEGNKLNYVSSLISLVSLRVQRCLICIELLHAREVSLADANNDDGKRKA